MVVITTRWRQHHLMTFSAMFFVVSNHMIKLIIFQLECWVLGVLLLFRMLGVLTTKVSLPLILPHLMWTTWYSAWQWHVAVRVRL